MENTTFRTPDEMVAKIVDLYTNGCYKKSTIYKMTGVSRPTIDKILSGLMRGTKYLIDEKTDQQIIDLFKYHYSTSAISKNLHISSHTVISVLKFHSVVPDKGRRMKVICGINGKDRMRITQADYELIINKQGNKCALCGKDFDYTRALVDHKHGTKIIRGLLCSSCNLKLSGIEDNEFLQKALKYLSETES